MKKLCIASWLMGLLSTCFAVGPHYFCQKCKRNHDCLQHCPYCPNGSPKDWESIENYIRSFVRDQTSRHSTYEDTWRFTRDMMDIFRMHELELRYGDLLNVIKFRSLEEFKKAKELLFSLIPQREQPPCPTKE